MSLLHLCSGTTLEVWVPFWYPLQEDVREQAPAHPAGHHSWAIWPHLPCSPSSEDTELCGFSWSIFSALQRWWCCCITLLPWTGNEWELYNVRWALDHQPQRDLGEKNNNTHWKINRCTLGHRNIFHRMLINVASNHNNIAPKAHFPICKRVIMISFTNVCSRPWEGLCVQKKY